ncbi:MAG: hypothetical protein FJ121_06670 [Deltaproteobacteria bacterium]|nr:hypothetical protein [Deltaproteobacteria bacterium]
MMRDHTTPICPIPGLDHCVRERCNFWDEDNEECTADCFDTGDPVGVGAKSDPNSPCVISFYEDYD